MFLEMDREQYSVDVEVIARKKTADSFCYLNKCPRLSKLGLRGESVARKS